MKKLSAIIIVAAILFLTSCSTDFQGQEVYLYVEDKEYEWHFDPTQDLQLPELPTGCEATAASTIARKSGIPVTKQQIADSMPKSDWDWVNRFLGDPYAESGWAISSKGITDTLNKMFRENGYYRHSKAMELMGVSLEDLPHPCVVWVTIGLREPIYQASRGFYDLYTNTHAMVLLGVADSYVRVIDPLEGEFIYPKDRFEYIYNKVGMHAVYIKGR